MPYLEHTAFLIRSSMNSKICLVFLCLVLSSSALASTEALAGKGIKKRGQRHGIGNTKLFVFGDSYADTGNSPRTGSISWRLPYGISFPGKPSGRFSDGRVLTDYIASFLGIKSPMPYERKNFTVKSIQHGINFAYGGTGVYNTLVDQPNMTTQIDLFQQLIDKKLYTSQNLSSSIALVSLGGNDYGTYLAKNGTLVGMPSFIRSVIKQLMLNVNRIHDLGIKKIIVTGMEPAGCLPRNTASISHSNCIAMGNNLSLSHNLVLDQNLRGLNYNVTYLKLYDAFISGLQMNQTPTENSANYVLNLKPCCAGPNGEDCGMIGTNGEKRYRICQDPNKSFFWDSIHPSNNGWATVYKALLPSLKYDLLM